MNATSRLKKLAACFDVFLSPVRADTLFRRKEQYLPLWSAIFTVIIGTVTLVLAVALVIVFIVNR